VEAAARTCAAFKAVVLVSVEQREIVIHEVEVLRTLRRLPPARMRAQAEARKAAKQADADAASQTS